MRKLKAKQKITHKILRFYDNFMIFIDVLNK